MPNDWTRTLRWIDPCNDSILSFVAFTDEPTWKLNVAGQTLIPVPQITVSTPELDTKCRDRITTTFAPASDLDA